ncbi:terminase family protein [Mesorhizobium sp.]|uniref:terminase large subunit domain-containing protein n=1 Tax=Mesorhizobium sp. TaxID=1871066 RepID=UPI00120B2BC2|nr:terminase family protein [Mesorhizobium sp.]TIN77791.1 MAG: hypothetical protein E5Y09_16655 [Mesorhizobium sp.]
MKTLLDALDDPKLFAPWFRDVETWQAWRAFLAALFGLPMSDEQMAIFTACTARQHAPAAAAKEAWLIIGRRGGKSFMMALCAVFLACFRDYTQFLAPGERATILVIAADRKQARVIMRYVNGLLSGVPALKKRIEREAQESVDLTGFTTIEVATANFRTVRGYTLAAALCDEIAFWRSEDSASPDKEVLDALRPAMLTIPNAMLLCASSPYARRGVLWDARQRHYGHDAAPLVWQASTRTMNPSVPQEEIDKKYEEDAAVAAAEYGARFRSDLQSFVDREAVDACVELGMRERPFERQWEYTAFVDPSGGAVDAMTLGIAHREGKTAILDAIREIKPPFNPAAVVEEFALLMKTYKITSVYGDRYAGEWPREAFRHHGINYILSGKTRSDIYRDTLPLINAGLVSLLDNPKMIAQLLGLERRVAARGKDSIDHPPGGHDDLINAAAGALEKAYETDGRPRSTYYRPKPKPVFTDPLEDYR